jgi:prefoldin subunit 5
MYGKMELNKIEEEIDWLTKESNMLRIKKDSLDVAIDVLNEAGREMQRDFFS